MYPFRTIGIRAELLRETMTAIVYELIQFSLLVDLTVASPKLLKQIYLIYLLLSTTLNKNNGYCVNRTDKTIHCSHKISY